MKPLDRIVPTEAQRNCINYSSGDLLINGVPGSGKSIVLLKRSLELYRNSSPDATNVVLLTTYSTVLNSYTEQMFRKNGVDERKMAIMTLDSFAGKAYRAIFGEWINYTDERDREKFVEIALQNHYKRIGTGGRLYNVDVKFWIEEFIWIKQKNIRTYNEYYSAERIGRGGAVRITREDRKTVFEVFNEYQSILKTKGKMDTEDVYAALVNHGALPEKFRFDYVLVDESQDLSFVKLKLAKMAARKSITIAADKAQKIYYSSFTWRELGIDIRGNASKKLTKAFRSTKQIVQLADSLAEINRARDNDKSEYTDPVFPSVIGESFPHIFRCATELAEKTLLVMLIRKLLVNNLTIGVLYRSWDAKNTIESLLRESRIPFQEISKNSKWALSEPGVKLVTLHSSKGLEFDCVIIPFFNAKYYPHEPILSKADQDQKDEIIATERNLLYVGMTRAKESLYLTYSGEHSRFLSELNPDYYVYLSPDGTPLQKPVRSFVPQKPVQTIRKNGIIRAHFKGDKNVKVISGENIDKWVFIGKKVGDIVVGPKHTFVVDSIVDPGDPLPEENCWYNAKIEFPESASYYQKLENAGVPDPETIGAELMDNDGGIIAEAELAWEAKKMVFLNDSQQKKANLWKQKDYTVITKYTNPESIRI